jgi:hypothetical protein
VHPKGSAPLVGVQQNSPTRQVKALQLPVGVHCPSVHPRPAASAAVQQNSSTRQLKALQLPPPLGVSVGVAAGASVGVGVEALHAPSTHCSPATQQTPLQQPVAQFGSVATGWQAPPLHALQTWQVGVEPAVH